MFKERLIKAMKDLNLNQKQVSILTGSSKAAVSQWVSGKNVPSEVKQTEIANSLNLPDDYFSQDDSKPTARATGQVERMIPEDAAKILGVDKTTIRKGLQDGVFPWGYAIHMDSGRWVYFINAARFRQIECVKS